MGGTHHSGPPAAGNAEQHQTVQEVVPIRRLEDLWGEGWECRGPQSGDPLPGPFIPRDSPPKSPRAHLLLIIIAIAAAEPYGGDEGLSWASPGPPDTPGTLPRTPVPHRGPRRPQPPRLQSR